MAKDTNKTIATPVSADAYIEAVADGRQREDARKIAAMLARLTGDKAIMWGPSIIGFGNYHYKYDSGREGDMCRIGFSPRKGQTVIYVVDGYANKDDLLAKLGKHKTGQSCLYIKKLADVDETVLEEICSRSLAHMDAKYPR
jgi:hypothetical protein